MSRTVLGLDVGGANLKAAHVGPHATLCRTRSFALWRDPLSLPSALTALVAELPCADELAVTMTGELCDCFATKRDGIRHILAAVETVANDRPVRVWTTNGYFIDLENARSSPPVTVAASNWLALATWAGRLVPEGGGLLLDVGSTTTDIIALQDGKPIPQGRDDFSRLRSGELIYRGARRTPVCALTQPNDAVAAEWFATTLDVFLALGDLPEDFADTDTADGRPATRHHALARLHRMFCLDAEAMQEDMVLAFARSLRERLVDVIRTAVERRLARLGGVVLAGSGEFLGRLVLSRLAAPKDVPVRLLSEILGQEASTAACAHAVAVLRSEM